MKRNFPLSVTIIGFIVLTVASFIFSIFPVLGPAFLAFVASRLFWETRIVAIWEFMPAAILGNLLMALCMSTGFGQTFFWIYLSVSAVSSILGMIAGIIKEERDSKKSVTT